MGNCFGNTKEYVSEFGQYGDGTQATTGTGNAPLSSTQNTNPQHPYPTRPNYTTST